ncbi:AbiH family protein [Streptococcus gordonii]|uniref:AbiH family protein n=1 Tax=Streptococcus gordonii TaxID=1302 RepID=UPI00073C9DD4|nr:AbiH family protein [Streptococcus gordonii]KTF21531.1 phage abortive infection protein [Streptococcus gordonii]KXC03813.1 phage abortive infection protein [Streptococcus gordonii]MBZ2148876.1 bacteriophage abortive infection AbiH family protein [Streptococcus gordonii]MBZ2149594.1 bacteriophage abortive infection AbiH family protein [Streptococcus gordonii]QWZ57255.1 bacteriophage abortive infection AbiH family protein [Streptococcus gordonii]
MADTILILGNGFDLSMGRKTSYSDFAEFANNLFPITDIQLKKFLDENNINIEEYRDNFYLRFINENRTTLGENWSNLEIMISQLAEAIDFYRSNPDSIYYSSENTLRIIYPDKFRKELVSQENFASKIFVAEIFYKMFTIFGWARLERRMAISELNELFISHLELLTNLLEIYLSYRDYIDFEIDKISPVETALNAITDISESYVISFNYTHTPYKLYRIPKENTHYIHGEIDLSRHKSEINTMVFGIEDKEIDVNSSLIPYQKYYQRIVKETGSEYLDFLKPRHAEDLYGGLKKKNIIVFGHSVDPLDKEIFQNCFALTSHYTYNYRFIFTYYNESAKRSIVKNLAIILGKDKLVELTGNKNVVFVKSGDVDGMKEVLLD